jgi:hypothetical protein
MKSYLSFTSKSLFKLILICSTGFYVPVALLMGVLAWLDIVPATLNEQQYTGFKGFAIYIAFIPVFILILAVSHWVMLAIGLKLFKIGANIYSRISNSQSGKLRQG